MQFKIIPTKLLMLPGKLALILLLLGGLISGCATAQTSTAEPTLTADADDHTPASQVIESTSPQTSGNGTMETFSSDQLGLCFSYPQGYTQIPYLDTVQLVAHDLAETDLESQFWFEISASDDRTAEAVADKEVSEFTDLNVGLWYVTLDDEEALVLDGMPGQDLVRKVYVVHQQRLYILTFSPTQSANSAANDQMEKLYGAVTSSWSWSPCSKGE